MQHEYALLEVAFTLKFTYVQFWTVDVVNIQLDSQTCDLNAIL